MSMKASIRWAGGVSFVGRASSGHDIVMDGSMEVVLIGMGGCTAFDVMHILRKQRQDVTDCVADIEAQRAEVDPKVFTHIHVHFKVTGRKLDAKKVEHAIELSATKYCSASIMLGKTAEITHDFEIVEVS
jgi:putative redox protein